MFLSCTKKFKEQGRHIRPFHGLDMCAESFGSSYTLRLERGPQKNGHVCSLHLELEMEMESNL